MTSNVVHYLGDLDLENRRVTALCGQRCSFGGPDKTTHSAAVNISLVTCLDCARLYKQSVDWTHLGEAEPKRPVEGDIWRRGARRFIRIGQEWVESGSFEELSKFEQATQDILYEI